MKHELIQTISKKEDILAKIADAKIEKALLFCNKKRDIESLTKTLNENEYKAFSLYNGVEEDAQAEILKTFNKDKKVFIVCSDSIAKKVGITGLDFVIGTELPTRANDYRTRLSYLNENGQGFTFHNGNDEDKLKEINRVMDVKKEEPTTETKAKPAPAKKPATAKKTAPAKKATAAAGGFGGHIPEFLKIDVSYLIKKDS